jgi:hydrogenase nickel incorporation protein HypB
MCGICGCSTEQGTGAGQGQHHPTHSHSDRVTQADRMPGGKERGRAIQIEAALLGENNRLAERNRAHFASHGLNAFNLVSSPGSGKTTFLCASIERLRALRPHMPVGVIEGDQQTSLDAQRIRAAGAPAIQVNTGRGCHLDAQMVHDAFMRLELHVHAAEGAAVEGLLFIENVGNLVCPAMWDLGETAKVVILSVTEGEDKPMKYPDMFAAAKLMILNKIDLLPYVAFDVANCIDFARRINPSIDILAVSATRGDGMQSWLDWLFRHLPKSLHDAPLVEERLAFGGGAA